MTQSKQEPAKWRKYRLLTEFGLSTLEDIEREIVRVRWEDRLVLLGRISDALTGSERRKMFFVIKCVPHLISGQLPNIRVHSLSELADAEATLRQMQGPYVEAWACGTVVDDATFSVAGRLAFFPEHVLAEHTIEQIWRASPRLLENYNGDTSFSLVSASRPDWGWRFRVNAICAKGSDSKSSLLHEFFFTMLLLERQRNQIEQFSNYLSTFTARSFSLEYKVIGSKLRIIDWDTYNDMLVLNSR
ncbi:MAG TPA: hypothetical protein VHE55_05310 [Fimbriimonadaceae bacterium]|nr:hypothetical protein [Fimbriimonadaceae bacterium]